jgi:hypothetical protein
LYCHTTLFCGVTSKTIPGAPEQISVFPLGNRMAPEMLAE